MSPVIISCPECGTAQDVEAFIPPSGLRAPCFHCHAPLLIVVDGAGEASATCVEGEGDEGLQLLSPNEMPDVLAQPPRGDDMPALDLSSGLTPEMPDLPELGFGDVMMAPEPTRSVDFKVPPNARPTPFALPILGESAEFPREGTPRPTPMSMPTVTAPPGYAPPRKPAPKGTIVGTPPPPIPFDDMQAAHEALSGLGAMDTPSKADLMFPVGTSGKRDLPVPVGPANLPAPVGPANLPTPVGGRDLPTPFVRSQSPNLPTPQGRSSAAPLSPMAVPPMSASSSSASTAELPELGMDLLGDLPEAPASPLDSLDLADPPARAPAASAYPGMEEGFSPASISDALSFGDANVGFAEPPDFGGAPSAFGTAPPAFGASPPAFGESASDFAMPGTFGSAAMPGLGMPQAPVPAPLDVFDSGATADPGFSLSMDGSADPGVPETLPMNPSPGRPLPAPGTTFDVGDERLPSLAPVTAREGGGALKPVEPRKHHRLLLAAGIGLGVAALGAGGFYLFGPRPHGPRAADVLGTGAEELARDHFPAYGRGAEALLTAAGDRPDAHALRAAAAEKWLLSVLARGADRGKITRADQALSTVPTTGEDAPAEAARARALLAIARAKMTDVVRELGAEAESTDGRLVLALRDLADGKLQSAAKTAREVLTAEPGRLVAAYIMGRALEETSPAEAQKLYRGVLAKNPTHFGAALGLARMEPTPEQRLAAVEKLLSAATPHGGPGEIAEGHVAVGRAAHALGRSAEAVVSFTKALALDSQSSAAIIALGEALLLEGRYQEALQRLRTLTLAGQRTVAGRFALGGALLATGSTPEGLGLVQAATRENPRDPRGLYWAGFAAEVRTPPAVEEAAQSYRAALKLDPKFLPASLKLAAMFQQQGQPQQALAVLQEAEKAGVPATALQLAFGEALIVAKEPARAEEVFRKAVAVDGKLVAAHLGVAAAQEAQGKSEAGRETLTKALAAMPDQSIVRERLAALTAKMGLKDQAMDIYKAELATGKATLSTRVAMSKLALELGRLDEALGEVTKVVDENPLTEEALFTLARVWEAKGDLPRAISEYRRAQRFDSSPHLNLAMARALLRAGKEPEAVEALGRALVLADGRVERGKLVFRKGEYERALEDFDAAAKMAPEKPEPPLWQGLCHDQLGATEKAYEAWATALKLKPDLAQAHYQIGRLAFDKGQGGKAVNHLRMSTQNTADTDPWAIDLYLQLGLAEKASGSRSNAVKAYRKYLELAPADAPSRPEAEREVKRLQ